MNEHLVQEHSKLVSEVAHFDNILTNRNTSTGRRRETYTELEAEEADNEKKTWPECCDPDVYC